MTAIRSELLFDTANALASVQINLTTSCDTDDTQLFNKTLQKPTMFYKRY